MIKDYKSKPSMRLLPWKALSTVALVMKWAIDTKGYPEGNWKDTNDGVNIFIDAALRHLGSVCEGEELDPESGLPHLGHAAASVLFALWHQLREKSTTSPTPSRNTPPTPEL